MVFYIQSVAWHRTYCLTSYLQKDPGKIRGKHSSGIWHIRYGINIMVWFLMYGMVWDICNDVPCISDLLICYFPSKASGIIQFPLWTSAEMKTWWIQGSFCYLTSSEVSPSSLKPNHPPYPPSLNPSSLLEHGDFTLLLYKACFSVWVWQTHGFLQVEVTEENRRILIGFF